MSREIRVTLEEQDNLNLLLIFRQQPTNDWNLSLFELDTGSLVEQKTFPNLGAGLNFVLEITEV